MLTTQRTFNRRRSAHAGSACLPWMGSLLLLLVSSCGGGNPAGPAPAAQVPTKRLGLTVGPGVTVTPTPQKQDAVDGTGFVSYSSQFTEGNTVNYRFEAQDGIARVTVNVDDTAAPAIGTIRMDKDHSITAAIDNHVGAPMPAFVGQDADGRTTRTLDLQGKVAYVDFGEMTCPGSIAGAPALRTLYNTYHPRGLEIVTVLVYGPTTNVASTTGDLRTWQQTYSLQFSILLDPSKATKIFNYSLDDHLTAFPTGYLVDRAGVIRFRNSGWDEAGLRTALATFFP